MARATLKAPILGKTGKADLPAALFGEDFHETLVHETARAETAARRRGTASTLSRGEIAMTGAKAWRQKGTGRARVGALSVPHRRGGGVAFGPKPRAYTFKVNRKARRKALRAALSVHAARGSVAVLATDAFGVPSTKQAAAALGKWDPNAPTLLVLASDEEIALKSFRNMPSVSVVAATAAGVADIVAHRSLVISEAALAVLEARAAEVRRGGSPTEEQRGTQSKERAAEPAEEAP